jgi:hypothetical protein
MEYCSDFRYDLEVGQVAEAELADTFTNKKVEVKRDLMAKKTGNIFIEYESRGKPSGLATTHSDFYCFVIEDLHIMLPTSQLKDIARSYIGTGRDVLGGDNNTSKGILLRLKDLIP